LEARLSLELTANYTARPPETSNDLDGGPLHHRWWSNIGDLGEGPLLEKVLPAGPYFIVLTTFDGQGKFSTDNLELDRQCI